MTSNISFKTTIHKSLDEVWNFLANFENAPHWMPGVKNITQVDPGELGRGSMLELVSGGTVKTVKVSYWEPLKCFTLSTESNSRSTDSSYRLESDAQNTILELNITTSVDGLRQLLLPVVALILKLDAGKRLENLKQVIESQP